MVLQEFLDKRKMTEFGSLALVDTEEGKDISLPGEVFDDKSNSLWLLTVTYYIYFR